MSVNVENVSFTYGGADVGAKALKDVSFSVEAGEFVGIMGHTGSGKSTLIQLMAGLLKPSSGRVFVDGKDINQKAYDRTSLRRKVGILFQYPESQLFETTVAKDVAFGLRHSGLTGAEMQERVRWALEVTGFDFEKIRKQSPMGLSGGEKRWVAIAGVLAARPEYLILDEPIAGLDPLGRDDFLRLMTRLNGEEMTIIMVSHNADCLGEYARRILVFDHGHLVEDGTVKSVFSDVEKMRSRSLGVSQSREIAYLLSERGVAMPADTVAYDERIA